MVADGTEEGGDLGPFDGGIGMVVLDFDEADVFFGEIAFLGEETDDVHFVDLVLFASAKVEGGPEGLRWQVEFGGKVLEGEVGGDKGRNILF